MIDRYLVNLVIRFERKPVDFNCLAVAAIFLAAKVEQPFKPSLARLLDIARTLPGLGYLNSADISSYENKILVEIEFTLHFVLPIFFLDRFEHIFGSNLESNHRNQMNKFASQCCLFAQCDN